MAVMKRFYLSRRLQFVTFVILLIFMIYYAAVVHNGAGQPLDLTRRYECNPLKKLNCFPKRIAKMKTVVEYIENTLEEALKEDKGTGCDIPKLDPFAKEVMQFNKDLGPITCSAEKDWVKCYMSKCRIVSEILHKLEDVKCKIRDIIYLSDKARYLGPPTQIEGSEVYTLVKSDHIKITCTHKSNSFSSNNSKTPSKPSNSTMLFGQKTWKGHALGFRESAKAQKPPPGREDTFNVLIFGFDSTAKNGFIRKMPTSYKVLTDELGATVLNGYNIVGDGTPAALFPILTGKTELELPEVRRSAKNSGYLDQMPFIFYKLKEDGYRTAYFEDMPDIGTFQYRFNGFLKQPADHYLRAFYLEEASGLAKKLGKDKYCVGDTPRFKIMMNITDQFLQLDGKRFAFTFIADITHNDFNAIGAADLPTAEFLKGLKAKGRLEDTLLFVMGDHGPRYANVRDTFQGKLEERLPLMAVRLPDKLRRSNPELQAALESNTQVLTTPHDIHATILDALDMAEYLNPYKVKGADLPRGMTLLEPIPRNRSCSEAAIEPHWCTCLKWDDVPATDPLYNRVVNALVDHINSLTEFVRSKCAIRKLTSIQWVMKRRVNKEMLMFQGAGDNDGYVGKFGGNAKLAKDIYQVKITVSPGVGVYEAAVTHITKDDTLHVNTREISRTNAYNNEPGCVSATYPHLNMYCYCNT